MKQTKSDLLASLAYALEIKPDDIMRYEKYPTGYAVLTQNFQKFTDVQPITPPKKEKPPKDVPVETLYPEGMPNELRDVYDHPKYHKMQDLKDLAYFLEIPDASAFLKAALIEEIDAWKVSNG
jgi:hypothetical protein